MGPAIGLAIASRFAHQEDRVLILGRRAAVLEDAAQKLNAEIGADLVDHRAVDLSVPANVGSLRGSIGTVDVLVNNAGGVDRSASSTLDDVRDAWLSDLSSNLVTAALLTEVVEGYLRRPGGRIVNVSSIAALRGGGDSYSAAKAGVIGWTLDLARRLGPDGVTANVVAAGLRR